MIEVNHICIVLVLAEDVLALLFLAQQADVHLVVFFLILGLRKMVALHKDDGSFAIFLLRMFSIPGPDICRVSRDHLECKVSQPIVF